MSHHKRELSEEIVIHNKEKGTLTLKPRALDITWSTDPRYWKFSSPDPSSPVELLEVCWLEVKGKAPLSYFVPEREYAVKFKVELKPDNFGWANPVSVMAKTDQSQCLWKKANLNNKAPGKEFDVPIYGVLKFKVPKDVNGKVVEFGMYEIWNLNWKGGLVINEVVIQPISNYELNEADEHSLQSSHSSLPQQQRPFTMSHHKGEKSKEIVIHNKEKGTLTLKPRALDITWSTDPRYWKFSSPDPTSPVELLRVCWLEVKGKARLSYFVPEREYAIKFKVELKPNNFGWKNPPVYVMAKTDPSQRLWKKTNLSKKTPGKEFDVPIDGLLTFKVPKDVNGKVVEFGMYEIWDLNWKEGLVINEVVIQPVSNYNSYMVGS